MEGIDERLLRTPYDMQAEQNLGKRRRGRPRKIIRDPTCLHFMCKHKPQIPEDDSIEHVELEQAQV